MNVSTAKLFIGWDVGAWNCEKNNKSRDALVILDTSLQVVGKPWRGNLRDTICGAFATDIWLSRLFELCKVDPFPTRKDVVLAIDTPLGFSDGFVALLTHRKWAEPIGAVRDNPYLTRETERRLFNKGKSPLSAVTHMIGNQATKGIHAVAKFAQTVESCGVWTDGDRLHAIEAYPALCEGNKTIALLKNQFDLSNPNHTISKPSDQYDALNCAFIAFLFSNQRHLLEAPTSNISENEGWIWAPLP